MTIDQQPGGNVLSESAPGAALQDAKAFARDNLNACAKDIVQWQDTGLLPDGPLRQLGEICKPLEQNSYMRFAESLVNRAALDATLERERAERDAAPDGVWEALQRLIENAATLGPASRDDALLVARYRNASLKATPEQQARAHAIWKDILNYASLPPLLTAAQDLVRKIEGVGCVDFRDANGLRVKDTTEWCAFYVALKECSTKC